MKNIRIAVLSVLLWLSLAWSQDTVWKDQDGTPIPDSPSQKSIDDFGGIIIATTDADWQEKWDTPVENVPHFSTTSRIAVGETVTTLIGFSNAKMDASGIADVRCDLKITRPDQTVSAEMVDIECFRGPIQGDPYNIRLTAATIEFVGEPSDPLGDWVTEVKLTDAVRNVSLDLVSVITLHASEP